MGTGYLDALDQLDKPAQAPAKKIGGYLEALDALDAPKQTKLQSDTQISQLDQPTGTFDQQRKPANISLDFESPQEAYVNEPARKIARIKEAAGTIGPQKLFPSGKADVPKPPMLPSFIKNLLPDQQVDVPESVNTFLGGLKGKASQLPVNDGVTAGEALNRGGELYEEIAHKPHLPLGELADQYISSGAPTTGRASLYGDQALRGVAGAIEPFTTTENLALAGAGVPGGPAVQKAASAYFADQALTGIENDIGDVVQGKKSPIEGIASGLVNFGIAKGALSHVASGEAAPVQETKQGASPRLNFLRPQESVAREGTNLQNAAQAEELTGQQQLDQKRAAAKQERMQQPAAMSYLDALDSVSPAKESLFKAGDEVPQNATPEQLSAISKAGFEIGQDGRLAEKPIPPSPRVGEEVPGLDQQAEALQPKKRSVSDDPQKWELKTQARADGADQYKPVGQFKDVTIERRDYPRTNDSTLVAVNKNGEVVGDLFYGEHTQNPANLEGAIEVRPDYRRNGIASELYRTAEGLSGKAFQPSLPHSADAEAFWQNRNRQAGQNAPQADLSLRGEEKANIPTEQPAALPGQEAQGIQPSQSKKAPADQLEQGARKRAAQDFMASTGETAPEFMRRISAEAEKRFPNDPSVPFGENIKTPEQRRAYRNSIDMVQKRQDWIKQQAGKLDAQYQAFWEKNRQKYMQESTPSQTEIHPKYEQIGIDADSGQPILKQKAERRLDVPERKRVSQMSPEEMQKELLTSESLNLPNKRAFLEEEARNPSPAISMSDADGLKAFNDKFGYEYGNKLLEAKAEALKEAGLDAYHEKGDEFLQRDGTPEDLQNKLEKARELLRNKEIEVELNDGTIKKYKGVDFSYGVGKDLSEAEANLKQHKADREARGERARGELRGITEAGSQAGEVNQGSQLEASPARAEASQPEGSVSPQQESVRKYNNLFDAYEKLPVDKKPTNSGGAAHFGKLGQVSDFTSNKELLAKFGDVPVFVGENLPFNVTAAAGNGTIEVNLKSDAIRTKLLSTHPADFDGILAHELAHIDRENKGRPFDFSAPYSERTHEKSANRYRDHIADQTRSTIEADKTKASEALKRLNEKLGRSHSGVPVDAIPDLLEYGYYTFKAGARTFAEWSAKMLKDFGEQVRPHLKKAWDDIQEKLANGEEIAKPKNLARGSASVAEKPKTPSFLKLPETKQAGGNTPPKLPTFLKTESAPEGKDNFAGNINLDKLNTPEEIKAELKNVYRLNKDKIETQRRGVVSDASVEKAAREMGLTADDISKWKKGGARNAETIFAARHVMVGTAEALNAAKDKFLKSHSPVDLANFQEAVAKHVAVQTSVAGATAEAGRALRQFRLISEAKKQFGRTNTEKVLDSIREAQGDNWEAIAAEVAKKLAQIPEGDTVALNKFLRNYAEFKTIDKIHAYWVSNVLSGPRTQSRNFISNQIFGLLQPVTRGVAAGVDAVSSKITGAERQTYAREVIPATMAYFGGIPDGLRRAAHIIQHGYDLMDAGKLEVPHGYEFPGGIKNPFNAPGRLLLAADAMSKTMHLQSELYALATRQAIREGLSGNKLAERSFDLANNPTAEMVEQATKYSRWATFNDRPTGAIASIIQAREKIKPLKFIAPFINTPTNILKRGIEYSPAGLGRLFTEAGKKESSNVIARAAIGSMAMAGFASLAANGKLTGAAPSDADQRDAFYRAGKQPFSVRVGDRWVAYNQMGGPLAITMAAVAAFHDSFQQSGEVPTEKKIGQAAGVIGKSIVDASFFKGISDAIDAIREPERSADNLFSSIGQGFVPFSGFLRNAAESQDPIIRDPQTMYERILTGIPGASKSVAPKIDPLGREVRREGGEGALAFLPSRIPKDQPKSGVDSELTRLGVTLSKVGSQISVKNQKFELSKDQQRDLQKLTGNEINRVLAELFSRGNYKALDDEKKALIVDKAIRAVREKARAEYLQKIHESDLQLKPKTKTLPYFLGQPAS